MLRAERVLPQNPGQAVLQVRFQHQVTAQCPGEHGAAEQGWGEPAMEQRVIWSLPAGKSEDEAILRSHFWMGGWPLSENATDISPSPGNFQSDNPPKNNFVCCVFQCVARWSLCQRCSWKRQKKSRCFVLIPQHQALVQRAETLARVLQHKEAQTHPVPNHFRFRHQNSQQPCSKTCISMSDPTLPAPLRLSLQSD